MWGAGGVHEREYNKYPGVHLEMHGGERGGEEHGAVEGSVKLKPWGGI